MTSVQGSFDDLRSAHIRYLELAGHGGELHVDLWSDQLVRQHTGCDPKFPENERLYFLSAIRYVTSVSIVTQPTGASTLADFTNPLLHQFPASGPLDVGTIHGGPTGRKKVIVTGCYDWLHTGHVRFFEEVSAIGDVYATVGNDATIEFLKGARHPQFHQDERRYVVGSLRYVKQALIASGHGWLDAAPEIELLEPDVYAVNEDGDKPEKRAFCQQRGIEYRVLKRLPNPGLSARSSTSLRGF